MDYFARLDEQNEPLILYRATPDMEEEVWTPEYGWVQDEFLPDVLDGSGDMYAISETTARKSFPEEAFE